MRDDPINFLLQHPDARTELFAIVQRYLARKSSTAELTREFWDLYVAIPSGVLTESDQDFLGELWERLDHVALDGEPDEYTTHPDEFRAWLVTAFAEFEAGRWSPA